MIYLHSETVDVLTRSSFKSVKVDVVLRIYYSARWKLHPVSHFNLLGLVVLNVSRWYFKKTISVDIKLDIDLALTSPACFEPWKHHVCNFDTILNRYVLAITSILMVALVNQNLNVFRVWRVVVVRLRLFTRNFSVLRNKDANCAATLQVDSERLWDHID